MKTFLSLATTIALLTTAGYGAPTTLPTGPLPDGLGVNIHFTHAKAGELEMIAAAGFKWIRMDFAWGGTERKKGEYDFAAYDHLLADLDKFGIRAIFILDYGNKMYDDGRSPHTEEGRAGFAKWAAAAVRHFKGRGVLWEMWNEPNATFWKPAANVDDYARLALATGKAIRDAEPGEVYIGPANSGFDLKFMEACFKAGCLEYWSAVSCHPYRQTGPESAASEYHELRRLIARYAPPGKNIPILSGEWGYSAAWKDFDEWKQGIYLPREFITNLWQGVPLSIWYDWHDDGTDAKEPEHHFGTVHNPYRAGQEEVYEPKWAYRTMKTLGEQLAGYRFNKRLNLGSANDFVMLFSKGTNNEEVKLVVWTAGHEPQSVWLPVAGPRVQTITSTGHLGGQGLIKERADEREVVLQDEPVYLIPDKPTDSLRLAAAMTRLPLEVFSRGPGVTKLIVNLKNPLDHAVTLRPIDATDDSADVTLEPGKETGITREVSVMRSASPVVVNVGWMIAGGGTIAQQTPVIPTNPLTAQFLPRTADAVLVRLVDPAGEGLKGQVSLSGIEGLEIEEVTRPVTLKPGETEAIVRFAAKADGADFSASVQVADESGQLLLESPHANYVSLPDFAVGAKDNSPQYSVHAEGDGKIASEQSLTLAPPPEGPPEPGMGVLKLAYKKPMLGWKFWRIEPAAAELEKIPGEPRALGLWVYGDGSGAQTRLRFTDSTGQTFQPSSENITWKGWRYIEFPMRTGSEGTSHWGGAKDGVIHYPIHWDAIFLLDRDQKKPSEGTVYISGPMLIRDGTVAGK